MQSDSPVDIRTKPRILIVDDSRIVRATLIKHIEGMFEFREAFDGEHAWEILLIDPGIRVVITDLTMPKLDGYGLLQRIRASKIRRLNEMPVIVISGSDEQEERARAKAAGASELITKGVATAQLLSRLDALSQLAVSQRELEQGLEALVRRVPAGSGGPAASEAFAAAAEAMLAYAVQHRKSFVLLNICIETAGAPGLNRLPDGAAIDAIAALLQRTVRQTDCVARTGDAEFTLATNGIDAEAAQGFAQRICAAIGHAQLRDGESMTLIASCGLSYLGEDGGATAELPMLRETAQRRARLGVRRGVSGVVSARDESLSGSQG